MPVIPRTEIRRCRAGRTCLPSTRVYQIFRGKKRRIPERLPRDAGRGPALYTKLIVTRRPTMAATCLAGCGIFTTVAKTGGSDRNKPKGVNRKNRESRDN